MGGANDELLPLFLEEATERLHRLRDLLKSDGDETAARAAQRELHTLKGASRMIGLGAVAELCHQAEDVLGSGEPASMGRLGPLVEQILERVTSLSGPSAQDQGTGRRQERGQAIVDAASDPFATAPSDDVRLPRSILDGLSDESARLRVISESAGGAVERLDQLARLAEGGVGGHEPRQVLAGLSTSLRRLALDTGRARRRFEDLVNHQLDTLLSLQVQPAGPFLRHLARHIEDLAGSLGKDVEVRIEGLDCRLDRRIVEALREALVHLGRNAIDHGVEDRAARRQAGKPGQGLIVLRAHAAGDRFRLEVADDGRGIDPADVLKESEGVFGAGAGLDLDPGAILQLLFRPGFSTRETVGEVSGRGVGLDAVAAAVRRVGGEVWVDSEPGRGTVFSLDLPVARRGVRVTVVEAAGFQIALPSAVIRGFDFNQVRAEPGSGESEEGPRLQSDIRTLDLAKIFGRPESPSNVTVRLTVSGRRFDLLVDEVIAEEEVFVRAFPEAMGSVSLLEGMALLVRGQAVGVMDVSSLDTVREGGVFPVGPVSDLPVRTRVLLVDDSRVTREMVRKMLTKEHFVVTAVDSAGEAIRRLGEMEVDCLVTDIDMPEMDGLELTRTLRGRPETAHIPIVLISTAGGNEDRLAGLDAGADAFVVKQHLDRSKLSRLLRNLGGGHQSTVT